MAAEYDVIHICPRSVPPLRPVGCSHPLKIFPICSQPSHNLVNIILCVYTYKFPTPVDTYIKIIYKFYLLKN